MKQNTTPEQLFTDRKSPSTIPQPTTTWSTIRQQQFFLYELLDIYNIFFLFLYRLFEHNHVTYTVTSIFAKNYVSSGVEKHEWMGTFNWPFKYKDIKYCKLRFKP